MSVKAIFSTQWQRKITDDLREPQATAASGEYWQASLLSLGKGYPRDLMIVMDSKADPWRFDNKAVHDLPPALALALCPCGSVELVGRLTWAHICN